MDSRLTDHECLQLQLDAIHRRTATQDRRDRHANRVHVERCWPDTLDRINGYWQSRQPDAGIPDYAAIATQRAFALLRQSQETK